MDSVLFSIELLILKIFTYSIIFVDLIFPKNKYQICIGAPDYSGNSYYFFNLLKNENTERYKII